MIATKTVDMMMMMKMTTMMTVIIIKLRITMLIDMTLLTDVSGMTISSTGMRKLIHLRGQI